MIDWTSVFEEAYPAPGASAGDLQRFTASVGQPLTAAEIAALHRGQSNPFPKSDPLYASWRPFDASIWQVPDRPLPATYLRLLACSNGGGFRTGERWFQFFPILDPGQGVRAMLLAYHLPRYMPGALPVAFNGGGTFYLFDMRLPARDGEYPIVCSHSGDLGWQPDQCLQIAESFEMACRGTVNVDELR
ncbi:MAG TPA: SMI1/KNR4 family protein [Pirellulaceae bacterium]|nr:SMI1/KNR4 family protein [Pirellulaceae bacterium]